MTHNADLVAAAKAVVYTGKDALNHYQPWDLVDSEWIGVWRPLHIALSNLEGLLARIDGPVCGA